MQQRTSHVGGIVFHAMFGLVGFGITAAATFLGYWQAKQFTQNRLRFVDAVQRAGVPVLVGIGAAVVAMPVVALLPLVGAGTAILFGAGVGLGVSAGRRDIRRRIGTG
jgi:hypothetical protein